MVVSFDIDLASDRILWQATSVNHDAAVIEGIEVELLGCKPCSLANVKTARALTD
jgi:hypothetical protein